MSRLFFRDHEIATVDYVNSAIQAAIGSGLPAWTSAVDGDEHGVTAIRCVNGATISSPGTLKLKATNILQLESDVAIVTNTDVRIPDDEGEVSLLDIADAAGL